MQRSPSLPSQTYHAPSTFPTSLTKPAFVESVASGAHYSGSRVEPALNHRRSSSTDPSEDHLKVKEDHKRALEDLKQLYGGHPSAEILERLWHKDAVFEDPFSACKGFAEYAPQWYAMPKMFSKSRNIATRVMSSTHHPSNRLVYSQTQEYTLRGLNMTKTVHSVITVDFDENGKIIRLVDEWDGKPSPSRFGAYYVRRFGAKIVPWLVHVPK